MLIGLMTLRWNSLANMSFTIRVPCAKMGIVSAHFVHRVQISPYKEGDATFNGKLVAANAPEDLRLLSARETINIDIGTPGALMPWQVQDIKLDLGRDASFFA